MNNTNQFFESLKSLEISQLSDEVIEEVSRLKFENGDFQPEIVAKVSKAAKNLCIFVNEICKYHELKKKKN